MLGGLGESVQQHGQLRDLLVSGLRFHRDLPLADLQTCRQGTEGLLWVAAHAPRQDGVEVPVSRRVITLLIAQYTRDSELAGRCS